MSVMQKVLFDTGSITGYHAIPQELLGAGYLSATAHDKQPLCGNEEGWGPMSPFRYDFTPCFIDVWVAIVAVYGLLVGAVAIWLLARQKTRVMPSTNLQYWLKQVGNIAHLLSHCSGRTLTKEFRQ